MFERFTDRARRVVVLAQEEARLLDHDYIGTEHILLGLVQEGEGVAARALESLGIALEAVRAEVERAIGRGDHAPSGHIPFTARAKKVLELSLREALQLGHDYIGTEHVLLGILREGEGVAAETLMKLGADLSRVRQEVVRLLSGYGGPAAASEREPVLRFASGRVSGGVVPPLPAQACSFCGRDLWEVDRYVTGSAGVICDACVESTRQALESAPAEAGRALTLPPRVFGEPPDGDAMAEIDSAVGAVFGGEDDEEWVRSLEDGQRLLPVRTEVRARVPPMSDISVRLDRVRFRGTDDAEMRFTISLAPSAGGFSYEGSLHRNAGRWQVTRDTYCLVIQQLGVRCPPPERE
jgi:hypothetical protein